MSATASLARARPALPPFVILGAGLLALIALFWPEGRAAVRVWSESTAYGHCFLVIPIILYLLWDRRASLRGLAPEPTPHFAWLALPLPFVWLAAERLGIMEGRQLAALGAVEVLFLTVLGARLFRAMLGPLLYLVFLVPFGAFLTPALQSITAWFIEVGLTLANIPHFINDLTIEIAAGTFFVAEACAGLRFLIASIAFGVFFALLNYNGWGRRTAFIAASIVVPVVANGFRALGIVALGNVLGSAEAAAADHLIYGWVFFSLVTLLLVAAGLPFREFPLEAAPARAAPRRPPSRRAALAGAVALVAVIALGPLAAVAMDRHARAAHLAAIPALVAPPGCTLTPGTPGPDRVGWTLACGGTPWTVLLQALPPGANGSVLSEARLRAAGPLDTDDAMNVNLPGAAGWRVSYLRDPTVVVATAAWVDGAPAAGGLRQRLLLARNSILGTAHAPAVMALGLRAPGTLSDAALTASLAELTAFIAAQNDLSGAIARATATP